MTNQKPDRDATIDRLLAGRATRSPGNATDACLDADTLAAWADDALDAGALAAAEAHAADCARCQAMLAAMARTTPLAPAQAAAPWWKPAFRWLVPLTAAAAAVLVWTIVPQRDGRVNVQPGQPERRCDSAAFGRDTAVFEGIRGGRRRAARVGCQPRAAARGANVGGGEGRRGIPPGRRR